MHSRRMRRWQDDQGCIFKIMTDARKIKISFTFEKKWPRNEEASCWKRRALCPREGGDGRYFRISSYFPFPYRHSVHLGNTAIPARKLVLSCEENRPFFPPSWQTREFRVYGPSEKEAQCTLCIVNVSKICTVVSYIKTDASFP